MMMRRLVALLLLAAPVVWGEEEASSSCAAQLAEKTRALQTAEDQAVTLREGMHKDMEELKKQNHLLVEANHSYKKQVDELKAQVGTLQTELDQAKADAQSQRTALQEAQGKLTQALQDKEKSAQDSITKADLEAQLAKQASEAQASLEQVRDELEGKIASILERESKKHDAIRAELQVAEEQLATTKDYLFETRRDLHQANEELRRKNAVWIAMQNAWEQFQITFVQEDLLGVVAAYQEHVAPHVQTVMSYLGPLWQSLMNYLGPLWQLVKETLLVAWHWIVWLCTTHIFPTCVWIWEETYDYRMMALDKLQVLTEKSTWQRVHDQHLSPLQAWLFEQACQGTDLLATYCHGKTKTTLVLDAADYVNGHCQTMVVYTEATLVTILVLAITTKVLRRKQQSRLS